MEKEKYVPYKVDILKKCEINPSEVKDTSIGGPVEMNEHCICQSDSASINTCSTLANSTRLKDLSLRIERKGQE